MTIETEPTEVQMFDRSRRIAEAVSISMGGDFGMTVGVGDPGSGWHWDFVKNHVNMDPNDLRNESDEVVFGIASHEGNHVLASRAEHVQDLWREPGFAFGFNAAEDPRVNEAGMVQKPGSRGWIKAYIERDLGEDGGLNYQVMEAETKEKLGYIPKHMKWGAEAIRYWHGKELADEPLEDKDRQKFLDEIPDDDVRQVVESTLDDFEEFYRTVPLSRDEDEVQAKAQKSAQNFKENIWPKYKELVEQSIDEQSLVEMLKDMLQSDQQPESGGQNTIEIPFDALPQEIQDEIRQKVKEQKQQSGKDEQQADGEPDDGEQGEESEQEGQDSGGSKGQPGSENTEGSDSSEQGQDSEAQDGDQSSGDSRGESGDGSGKSSDGADGQQSESQGEADSSDSSGEGMQIPWDELSDEAKAAAQKAFDKFSDEAKEKYEGSAKEALEDVEDDANEKLRGKMGDTSENETKREQREREAKEQREEQREEQKQQAAEQIQSMLDKARREAIDQLPQNPYHEFMQLPDIAGAIRKLDQEFGKIFEANMDPDVRFTDSGLRPNMGRVMQREANPRNARIFESRGRPTERSHRFLWNVDLSGSMGDKIYEVFKAVVIDIELSNKHGLETAVTGFTDFRGPSSIRTYKEFDVKRLKSADRDKLGQLLQDGMNGGITPLFGATEECFKMMKDRIARVPMNNNYFITLTDGLPTDASVDELARKITEIRKDRQVITAYFGVGQGTDFVNELGPLLHSRVRAEIARRLNKKEGDISNSFENAADFAVASVVIMRNMVAHPELFYD